MMRVMLAAGEPLSADLQRLAQLFHGGYIYIMRPGDDELDHLLHVRPSRVRFVPSPANLAWGGVGTLARRVGR